MKLLKAQLDQHKILILKDYFYLQQLLVKWHRNC